MTRSFSGAALAIAVAAAPNAAFADPPYYEESEGPSVQVFARLSLGGEPSAAADRLALGIGGYSGSACFRAGDDCREEDRFGFEYRLMGAQNGGFLVGPQGDLRVDASGPQLGLRGSGGGSGWLWLGLGLGAVALAALLAEEDSSKLCTGNTIPNPLTGDCEPLVL